MNGWIALLIAGTCTWAFKCLPSLLSGWITLPAALERANRYVAPAILGALTARGLAAQVVGAGGPATGVGAATLVAAAVAVPVAARTRSVLATVAGGIATFWALTVLLG